MMWSWRRRDPRKEAQSRPPQLTCLLARSLRGFPLYSTQRACVRIASAAGDLPIRVVVRESDGTEALLWEPSNEMPAGAQTSR